MKSIVVGTAGHIDHGKSSLVKALTGIDPDRLEEEKARGITIELGFAHLERGGLIVAFVDVPGHERFVRTMLAGAGGIDAVLLVVAADESVMPQTREHFDICRLLRVERGLVVLTKADLVDEEMLEIVRLDVRDLVAGSFLEGAPVLPVSVRRGQGLDALEAALSTLAPDVRRRTGSASVRLPIDRVFSVQGFGTVVTGTLVSGRIAVEDELAIEPGGPTVRVRGIEVHGQRQEAVEAGHRAALNLGGIEVSDISRGQTIATPGSLAVTRVVDAALDLLPSARRLEQGARVRFHQGTRETLGRVSLAGTSAAVEPGSQAIVRIRLEEPAALTRGDRFILRAYSPQATIAGGQVLDPQPPSTGVRTVAGVVRLGALAATGRSDDDEALARMIVDAGAAGLRRHALVSRGGVRPAEEASTVDRLVASGRALTAGDRLITPAAIEKLETTLLATVDAFHRAQPLAGGIPREEARSRVVARADPAIFELVLTRLAADGRLGGRERLARAGHRVELGPADQRAKEAIEEAYRRGGLKPPDATTIRTAHGLDAGTLERMTTLLVREKRLVRMEALTFHADALADLKRDVQGRARGGEGTATVDVAAFKERYGVTRKFAIPLLEWLDRERVTRRVGDSRVVL